MRTFILDTDIGNDVDDIFALIILAKARGLRLLGVTTVYGDTDFEARMTRYVLDKLGRIDVPVFPGEQTPFPAVQFSVETISVEGFRQILTMSDRRYPLKLSTI
jgi:inosine-uridine nucleoside N-ribohydrolase